MDIFEESKDSYISIRMTKELKARGRIIGQNKVAKMMCAAGLHPKRKKKFKVTTNSKHNYPVAPNILNQDFTVKTSSTRSKLSFPYLNGSNAGIIVAGGTLH